MYGFNDLQAKAIRSVMSKLYNSPLHPSLAYRQILLKKKKTKQQSSQPLKTNSNLQAINLPRNFATFLGATGEKITNPQIEGALKLNDLHEAETSHFHLTTHPTLEGPFRNTLLHPEGGLWRAIIKKSVKVQ